MNSNKANLIAFICLIATKYLLGIINRLPCLGSKCHDTSIGLDLFEEYMGQIRLEELPSQILLHEPRVELQPLPLPLPKPIQVPQGSSQESREVIAQEYLAHGQIRHTIS
jgi:hypothetical protein